MKTLERERERGRGNKEHWEKHFHHIGHCQKRSPIDRALGMFINHARIEESCFHWAERISFKRRDAALLLDCTMAA